MRLWSCAALLAALGAAALAWDAPLARWASGGTCPDLVQKLCGLSEVFGHGLGVVLIVVVIAVLDPAHRYAVPRIAIAALGSGLLANIFKLLVARARPHHFDLQADSLDSFVGWFPLLGNRSWEQGFPSSHTATAAGLAIALAYFYPRGRWLFAGFVALAGLQRVLAEAHFSSDVIWGAAVGCVFAPLCIYGGPLARALDRLEQQILSRSAMATIPSEPHHAPAPNARSSGLPEDLTHAA